ncbi:MAG: YkgJ family cysteine cluster protein [Deltaproteobacteria bacterium]|jgi:Fe-S-cluster containining protein|nr:YkgJ family cysteine cluster protein [Deltaproteobacteria bacterium]
MGENNVRTECRRCGECCLKGGPALHKKDLKLLQGNYISRESLITIRRGEPVFFLEKSRPEWTENEIIKLKGGQGEWSCIFYDRDRSSCSIYQHRPLECVLLKCWDTEDLEAVAGKSLLSRSDIIAVDEPVVRFINRHEEECGLEILKQLNFRQPGKINNSTLTELTELVNIDLALRSEAVMHLNLSLDLEIFYFGTPLFKILARFALIPKEVNGKIIMLHA